MKHEHTPWCLHAPDFHPVHKLYDDLTDAEVAEPRPVFLGPILDEGPRLPEHNGMLPKGVAKHPATTCREDWCGLEPVLGISREESEARIAELFDVPREIVCPENCKHPAHPQADLPAPRIRTQDELLTALDELLDAALHDDACFIEPHDTHCVCVIARVRAVLPPCGAVRPAPGNPRKMWPCLRNAHPASPDRHYFGEE